MRVSMWFTELRSLASKFQIRKFDREILTVSDTVWPNIYWLPISVMKFHWFFAKFYRILISWTAETLTYLTFIWALISSRWESNSVMFLVPKTFLRVVAPSNLLAAVTSSTRVTDATGSIIRQYMTASTDTVTWSLVRIWKTKWSRGWPTTISALKNWWLVFNCWTI